MTYMNKYIVMFSYENMMSAHIPIFAVLLLDQNIVVDTCELLTELLYIMMIVLTTTCIFIIVRNPQNKVRIKSGTSGLVFYWLTVLIAHDLYLLIDFNIYKIKKYKSLRNECTCASFYSPEWKMM